MIDANTKITIICAFHVACGVYVTITFFKGMIVNKMKKDKDQHPNLLKLSFLDPEFFANLYTKLEHHPAQKSIIHVTFSFMKADIYNFRKRSDEIKTC